MKFIETVEKLQKENPKTIILAKSGIFFVAIGKDAVALNCEVGLRRTCMRDGLCKVGFPIKTSEKYIDVMKEKELSFALFVVDSKTGSVEEIYRNIAKPNEEMRCSLNCEKCNNKKETDEDIIERLKNIGK